MMSSTPASLMALKRLSRPSSVSEIPGSRGAIKTQTGIPAFMSCFAAVSLTCGGDAPGSMTLAAFLFMVVTVKPPLAPPYLQQYGQVPEDQG